MVGNNPPLAISMPDTERDIWDWFAEATLVKRKEKYNPQGIFATIEKVSGFIGKAHPGSAMFKFGKNYGNLRMALIAADIPFEEITPQKWQKALGITPRKSDEPKGEWKNRLKAFCQQLYPKVKVTLATADALLIATFCQRKREGTL